MSSITDFADAAQGLAGALLAATTDPADSVQLLSELAAFYPDVPTSESGVGSAMATMQTQCGLLFRRAAIAALCQATATYEPFSYDDALELRTKVCTLLDAEIAIAGDEGADDTFNALRALRVAVVADLTARGADLARLVTVSSPTSVPAPVLAQRLYGDSSRADELVQQANPIHPAFMPISFKARGK